MSYVGIRSAQSVAICVKGYIFDVTRKGHRHYQGQVSQTPSTRDIIMTQIWYKIKPFCDTPPFLTLFIPEPDPMLQSTVTLC